MRRTAKRFRERTIWWEKAYDAGSNGTNLLKRLLGASGLFPFPKSVYAVRDVLSTAVGHRPGALILDFFAGSGTTLHATAMLNSIDDGRRRCVLVTNNEVDEATATALHKAGKFRGDAGYEAMGIFERVTAPRVRAAISGVRPDGVKLAGKYKWAGGRPVADGFDEAVEFFKLEYLDPDSVRLGDQLEAILPMLRLAAGAVGSTPVSGTDSWLVPDDGPWAILLDDSRFAKFRAAIEKRPDLTHVWLVTTSEEAFARMRVQLPVDLKVSMLYRDYLRNFEINTERA